VRDRQIRNGLDLLDAEDTKISLPPVEREQRIMIGAQLLDRADPQATVVGAFCPLIHDVSRVPDLIPYPS
jgi:hypothetical protein